MLYPLSYEGARAQPTCQRVLARTRAHQPPPTRPTCRRSDPPSKNGAHRSPATVPVPTGARGYRRLPISATDSPSKFRATHHTMSPDGGAAGGTPVQPAATYLAGFRTSS